MVKRDLDIIIINAVNTPPWLRDFKSRFYILERAFGANNVIFERNAVNTPPIVNRPQFSRRGGIYGEYNGIMTTASYQIGFCSI